MEAQNKWGMVVFAGIFAVCVVGIALVMSYLGHISGGGGIQPVSETFNSTWQTVSSVVATSSVEAPVSVVLSAETYAGYQNLAQNGTFTAAERDQMLADVVKQTVSSPAVVPNISLIDLNTSDNVSVDTYAQLLAVIMNQSSQVKNYELGVFTQTVTNADTNGTPELQNDADLYKRIAAALLVMPVPTKLAPQHLEVVKSIGALAKSVDIMAKWKGDPIEALADIDAFNKSESYAQTSLNTLFTSAAQLQKKT